MPLKDIEKWLKDKSQTQESYRPLEIWPETPGDRAVGYTLGELS